MTTDFMMNPGRLRKLRMRVDTDDPVYRGMKKLKVRGKDLTEMPDEIFTMTELEVLDLSPEREACLYYRSPIIPSTIGRLINLRVLMLDTNELPAVPPEITLLTNLEKLALSNNHLKTLPEGFARLTNLRSLHLANNALADFPPQLCELTELQFLDLSDNKLVSLPENIKKMQGLETLFLFINFLSILPDGLCDLVSLRSLWIGNNKLKSLPRRFGNLKQLEWGHRHTLSTIVDGNPLQHPPLEIAKRGIPFIERYFQQSDANRKR